MVAVVRQSIPPNAGNLKTSREIAADMPRLSGPVELSVTDRFGPAGERPMATAWVSDQLLARTVDVWSRDYGRPVTTQEAMEILNNVKRFGELFIRAKEEDKT